MSPGRSRVSSHCCWSLEYGIARCSIERSCPRCPSLHPGQGPNLQQQQKGRRGSLCDALLVLFLKKAAQHQDRQVDRLNGFVPHFLFLISPTFPSITDIEEEPVL